ncbi:hypothetical protein J4E93_002431 [Alternaria ventricosa]|uniref:uncharacterized protein n=1 Tax=Alternaria ventricosa TaxID=1187951 RepID=UPI0020C28B4C|nr:uncharacterized protein J4E93_002431 [Alternaria ventricosa]KAI4652232.1 hypothetical protein J4E93_002431 [Alternaria ventricosa]
MAVHPFLPGLAVEIIVNDDPLPGYDDDSDDPASPTTVTKYVEATSGVNFAIKVSITKGYPFPVGDIKAEISLDGLVVAHKVILEAEFFGEYLFMGRRTQIGRHPKIQKFCFAELEIVEGSMSLPDLASIGTITVGFTDIPKLIELDALRILGLIPREPTPLPLEERPEEELTPDELRQLVKQFKDRDTAAAKVKKEAVDKRKRVDEAIESSNSEEVIVVRSRDGNRRRGANDEVIVLD